MNRDCMLAVTKSALSLFHERVRRVVSEMDDDFYGDNDAGGGSSYNAFSKAAPGAGAAPSPSAPPAGGASSNNLRAKTNKIKVEEP